MFFSDNGSNAIEIALKLSYQYWQLQGQSPRKRVIGMQGGYHGATIGTMAALRRDPLTMLPLCCYHMGDYFRHWIKMQRSLKETPRVFNVNWFRKDDEGNWLWPGFSDNMRPLKWIVERATGRAGGKETPIGWMPRYKDLDWRGMEDFTEQELDKLMHISLSPFNH